MSSKENYFKDVVKSKSMKFKELPLYVGADVFIRCEINFPNSDMGFKIENLESNDFTYLSQFLSQINNHFIKKFKKDFAISIPDLFLTFPKDSSDIKIGFNLQMRRKKFIKKDKDKNEKISKA